jgi:hypothetical protein
MIPPVDILGSRLLGVYSLLMFVYEFEIKGHVMCSNLTDFNPGFV